MPSLAWQVATRGRKELAGKEKEPPGLDSFGKKREMTLKRKAVPNPGLKANMEPESCKAFNASQLWLEEDFQFERNLQTRVPDAHFALVPDSPKSRTHMSFRWHPRNLQNRQILSLLRLVQGRHFGVKTCWEQAFLGDTNHFGKA